MRKPYCREIRCEKYILVWGRSTERHEIENCFERACERRAEGSDTANTIPRREEVEEIAAVSSGHSGVGRGVSGEGGEERERIR